MQKINDVKGEIPNITNLATITALTDVENKIPNACNLVKKTEYLTVCSYHVMYACQSESTLYICLNVKELLAQNRSDI